MQEQTCASVCCADEDGNPYCFSCFYAVNADEGLLYFKSSADTHHAILMKKNPSVAGTVLPDKLNKLVVKGLQFEATVLHLDHAALQKATSHYVKKYPVSLAIPGEIWALQLNTIKMTDSSKVFGKKTTWRRDKS